MTHKISYTLGKNFRLNPDMVLSCLMCKSNIYPSLPFYSCPDEEGGTFNEPEAERRLAEARAAKLKDFQGNDLVIYSTNCFSASFVIYDCLILLSHNVIKFLLHKSFKVVQDYIEIVKLNKPNKLCVLHEFFPLTVNHISAFDALTVK